MKLFEDYTHPLTEEEKKVIKFMVSFLSGQSGLPRPIKAKPISAPKFVSLINREVGGLKNKFSEVRLRKCVNWIRCTSTLFICSSQRGYWEAQTAGEMIDVIDSMEERANSIKAGAHGLRQILNKKFPIKESKPQITEQKKIGALF